jgi:hypothetical protein
MAKGGSRTHAGMKKKPTELRASKSVSAKSHAPTKSLAGKTEQAPPALQRETDGTAAAPAASRPPLSEPQLPATSGKIGVFGGAKDRSLKPDDKLALPTGPHGIYERARNLNPKSFYCAMRWEYRIEHMSPEEAKRWWANKKIVVTNAANGNTVVVRAVDYGPHESSGLAISVSPAALTALGAEVGDEVEIALADPKLPSGKVE